MQAMWSSVYQARRKGRRRYTVPESISKMTRPKGYHHSPETKEKIGNGNRGKIHTPEMRKNTSLALKGNQCALGHKLSPEAKAKISLANRGRAPTIETREKLSKAMHERVLSPEHKAKIGNANRGRVHTAEARANMSKGQQGRVQTPEHIEKRAKANRGKKHSPETIAKLSEVRRKRQITPEAKLKISLTNKNKGIKPPSRKGIPHTPEWKAMMSATQKGRPFPEDAREKLRQIWANPEYKSRRLKELAIAQGHKQTKGEKAIEDIANYLLPNTYKYVGSGKDVIVINGLKPDFIHTNGQKKVIEFFGDYNHSFARTGRTREEEELYRMNKYRKVGYDCLIIWGKELKESPDAVAKRILAFHASRPKQTEAQPCLL